MSDGSNERGQSGGTALQLAQVDICGNKVIRGLVGDSLQGVIQQNDLT